jgi:hypothetical protein
MFPLEMILDIVTLLLGLIGVVCWVAPVRRCLSLIFPLEIFFAFA